MPTGLTMAAALATAWALDLRFGEPRDAWHPVAWLGRVLGPIGRVGSRRGPVPAFVAGMVAWIAITGAVGGFGWWVQDALTAMPMIVTVAGLALLLKPCFAWRMLRDEVVAVEAALAISLDDGRARVARLCSRDVSTMDASQVRETAIETLAENLNDSLVAPLFWFAIAGLPGAAVYRFANTADAMWGYRGRYEWFGKCAARADDVLSWLPARLCAALIVLFASRSIARDVRGEAARTPSPNGGWPMGAMALALNVRLCKPGVYVLNGAAASPVARDLASALQLATRAAWSAVGATIGLCIARATWA